MDIGVIVGRIVLNIEDYKWFFLFYIKIKLFLNESCFDVC